MGARKGKRKKAAKSSAQTRAYKDALKRPPSDVILVAEQRLFFLKVVQEMLNDPRCHSFSRPVSELWDESDLPGYSDKVSTPMDLGTIKERLDKNEYVHGDNNLFDFRLVVENVHLVFENCIAYNSPGSQVAKLSKKLKKEFDKTVCEMPLDTSIDDSNPDGASSDLPPVPPSTSASLLGTPVSNANRTRSTSSPAVKKRPAFGPLTTDLSPATPDNINGSPFKRHRGNRSSKDARILDFRSALDEPPDRFEKSTGEQKVPDDSRKIDAFGTSTRDEPDKLIDNVSKRKGRVFFAKRAQNEELISSILSDIIHEACVIQTPQPAVVVISDSSQSSRAIVSVKRKPRISKEAAPNRTNNRTQKRKRPRRVIQETPPSDPEDEDEIASVVDVDSIHDTQAIMSSITRNERQPRSETQSTEPSGRRKQKRNSFDATAEGKIHATLGAICIDVMGEIGTVDESYESIVNWIGGEVSESQLEEPIPAESSEDETPVQAPTINRRTRNRRATIGGPLLLDESPADDDDVVFIDVDPVPEKSTRATQRDRPVRTQNGSRTQVTGRSDFGLGSLELPSVMRTPPLPISGDLLSLNRCSTSLDIAIGNHEDERSLMCSSLDFRDWIYSAEQLDLGDGAREWLQNTNSSNVLNVLTGFMRQVEDANLLTDIFDSVTLDSRRQPIIIGSCARFLGNNLPKDMLSSFFDVLLKARDSQMKKGTDSLVYLLSNLGGSHGRKYELVQLLWVSFLDACRLHSVHEGPDDVKSVVDIGSKHILWSMFNTRFRKNFSQVSNHCDEKGFAKGDILVEKTMDSLLTFGTLFAYSLISAEESIPVVYTSNWDMLGSLVDSLAQRKYRSVEAHRQTLHVFLTKVCTQFADRLWKVEESFVMKVLETIKSICAKYNSACSCSAIPPFLSQFNVIGDIRARRRSIPKFLRSECDCALFLAWIYIAQQEKVSPKSLGKLSRHVSSVMKGKGVQNDTARALTHHLGLTLAISRGIGLGKPDPEKLLRSMLFAKVPNLSSVFDDGSSFDPKIILAWTSVLDTVSLRCRHLLAFGQGIHLYSDFMCSRISQALHCIERPESNSNQDVKKRETRRVLQSMFVEMLVKMLSKFVDILQLVVQFVERGSYTNFAAIDSLLISLEPLLKRLGSFSRGLISQIRSNKMSANSSRQDILSAIVSFVEQGLALCTVRARDEMQNGSQHTLPDPNDFRSQSLACSSNQKTPAFASFSKVVHSSILDTLIIMVQSPVLDNGSEQDMIIRRAASRALARTVGLCSISPEPVYSTGSLNLLTQVLSRSKMAVLCFSANQLQGLVAPVVMQGKDEILMKKVELLLQSEFWSVILEPTWSRVVLALTEQMEETIFGLWTVLLVVTYKERPESYLAKAVDTLSDGIQRAAGTDSNLEKWFHQTSFGIRCRETLSADPMDQSKYEMNGSVRLETFVDCLCVILKTWLSAKVYNLVTYIRSYINLGLHDKSRSFGGSTSEYFRSSRDIDEGEESILHTQILGVLFVVHASLSIPSSSLHRGGRAGYEKSMANSYLVEIIDSLTRAMTKLRKGMKTHDEAVARVQALVMTGLSTATKGSGGMELSITFGRFVRLCGTKKLLEMLITWNDGSKVGEFLNREPFTIKPERARDEPERSRLRVILKEGQTYRRQALNMLVQTPIATAGADTREFRQGLEVFCGLLEDEIVENLRHVNCGLWPDVCRVVKEIGKRAKKKDWVKGGQTVEIVKNKIMERLESSCTAEEVDHFRKELGIALVVVA